MARSPLPRTAPTLGAAQAAGFPLGGEPLAVDLADTLVTSWDPPVDLLADGETCDRFWALQDLRLPRGWEPPSLDATRQARNAVRRLLDAAHAREPLDPRALDLVNEISASASTTPQATTAGAGLERVERWHASDATALPLAAAARSAIDILTDPSASERLRRCANPACSMLFVNGDSRRQWCTPNVCGNRARVARHYRRHHPAAGS